MGHALHVDSAAAELCTLAWALTAVLPLLQLNFDENFEDGPRPDKMQEVPEWACA